MRRVYMYQQAFVLAFGVGVLFTGLVGLIWPHNDVTIANPAGFLGVLWHSVYTLGGLSLVAGIWRGYPILEAMGHAMVAALFAGTLILALRVVDGTVPAIAASSFLAPTSIGSGVRFWILLTTVAPSNSKNRIVHG